LPPPWQYLFRKGRKITLRKVVVTEYVTLDGVFEEPGVWSFDFWNEEAAQFKYDELFASDTMLLGRVTYEGFAKAWPTMEGTGEFGVKMNSMPKYVVTTTLQELEWNNSHPIRGNVAQEVARLKQQEGQDILISGSGQLVRSLMQHDLIDEYRFMLYPLVLGSGKRLFSDGIDKSVLKLVDSKPLSSGVVILTYQPEGKG
jgi:dihydrofolate reductase